MSRTPTSPASRKRLTPSETARSASTSRPESVSSSTANFGLSNASCSTSWRFFSPPEKPSLTERSAKSGSMSRSLIAPLTSLTQVRSFGASPRTAVAAERRKLDIDTPGTSTGYCMARNRPARARSSTVIASTSWPSRVTVPDVTWDFGWPATAYASVDLPEPLGPMTAWVSPARTVRSTPFRISLAPSSVATETCRSLISRVDMSVGCSVWWGSGAGDRQLGLDGRFQALAQLGQCDLGQDLAEEAADHQPACDVLGDAAALQVEQLLVVETARGARLPGSDDLARLDLEVGHRVGARVLGEHQVAVELERLGALRGGADDHVADPDGVRVRRALPALQRVLVQHVGPAVRPRVVDEQPLLQVLPGIGVAEPDQLGVAAGAAEGDGGAHPHEITAERDRHGLERGITAEGQVLGAHVDRVVCPLVGDDQREPGPIRQHDIEVAGDDARAALLDHDRGLGVRRGAQVQVASGAAPLARSGHRDRDRLGGAGPPG